MTKYEFENEFLNNMENKLDKDYPYMLSNLLSINAHRSNDVLKESVAKICAMMFNLMSKFDDFEVTYVTCFDILMVNDFIYDYLCSWNRSVYDDDRFCVILIDEKTPQHVKQFHEMARFLKELAHMHYDWREVKGI